MSAEDTIKCILLLPPDRPRSHARTELAGRGWDVLELTSAIEAMAELAICERSQAARSAWGLQRGANVILAIEEPAACQHVPPLLRAIRMYLPSLTVLECIDGQFSPLNASKVEDIVCPEDEADAEQLPELGAFKVTRDELNMLLELGETE